MRRFCFSSKKKRLPALVAPAEDHFREGLALTKAGRMPEAEAALAEAVRLNPTWPEPHYDLGNARREQGDIEGAIRAFRQALRLRPTYVQAEVNLANLLRQQGRVDQAIAAYRRVLARHPDLPDTHNNLGAALVESGDVAGAVAAFEAALQLRPDFAAALNNLGSLRLVQPGRADEGRALHGRAAALLRPVVAAGEPGLDTRCLLAESLLVVGEHGEAAALLRATIDLYPDAWRPRLALADTLRWWGRPDEAVAALPAVVPESARLAEWLLRGALALDLHRTEEAEAILRAAVKLAPRQTSARHLLSYALLTAGKFAEGFAAFEARLGGAPPALPGRAWNGGAPRGRRIAVLAEEGLGDTIHFARFAARLARLGAEVTLVVPAALVRLLARLHRGVRVVDSPASAPQGAEWTRIMSLPRWVGVGDPATLGEAYLGADADAVAAWKEWLGPREGLRVGVAWSGNPNYRLQHLRACPPAALAPLTSVPGVTWVSLQPGAAADALPGVRLIVPDSRVADMDDTAALIAALDLVITVDTAVAHLAGALGRPVWLLNRFNADWRWQAEGEHSVWYHSLRQFRQTATGDWSGAVAAAAARLRKEATLF